MKGTITKYRKKDGRVSWGYYYKAEGRQFTESGFSTKFDASKALDQQLETTRTRTESPVRATHAHWPNIFHIGSTDMPHFDASQRRSSDTGS
jgi:hypothetical protein